MQFLLSLGVLVFTARASNVCANMSLQTCLDNEKIYYMPPCDCKTFDEKASPKIKQIEYKCT